MSDHIEERTSAFQRFRPRLYRIARLLAPIRHGLPASVRIEIRRRNGLPAAVVVEGTSVLATFSWNLLGGAVRQVFSVRNADRLRDSSGLRRCTHRPRPLLLRTLPQLDPVLHE